MAPGASNDNGGWKNCGPSGCWAEAPGPHGSMRGRPCVEHDARCGVGVAGVGVVVRPCALPRRRLDGSSTDEKQMLNNELTPRGVPETKGTGLRQTFNKVGDTFPLNS